mmetsp:Transcript_31970/g.41092  ORF Transcript_31970/g.41092 Transcript_31970/m.41092 type:complete len:449 (+) Transcript_31970:18-1364(+)
MELDHGAGDKVYEPEKPPVWAKESTNLANSRLGSTVIFATDEWFATAECFLNPAPAVFDPDAFTTHGKLMDGWESRRRRLPGHDWCIIKLGLPGAIRGIEMDTAFFTGNQVPRFSIEEVELPPEAADGISWGLPNAQQRLRNQGGIQGTCSTQEEIEAADKACGQWDWTELVPLSELRPGYKDRCVHYFETKQANPRTTHLRINYYPDGGVARIRVYGDVSRDFASELDGDVVGPVDLAAVENGGQGLGYSNSHYGHPRLMLQSGRGINMGDGWETGRHGNRPSIITCDASGFSASGASDWAVIRLGAVCGEVEKLLIDTKHFKGNYPESVLVEACCEPTAANDEILASAGGKGHSPIHWFPLLPRSRMTPDAEHVFTSGLYPASLNSNKMVTHLKLNIFPDGGVMRLRVHGKAIAPIGQPLQSQQTRQHQASSGAFSGTVARNKARL